MKSKIIAFMIASFMPFSFVTPMVSDSLGQQFKKIFAYSDQYQDKKRIVEAQEDKLVIILTLLEKIDSGERLTIQQAALLRGLLHIVKDKFHKLSITRARESDGVGDMWFNLLSFLVLLEIPIKETTPIILGIFNDPFFQEQEEYRPRGSPDLCP
jgi:hypothetical protein